VPWVNQRQPDVEEKVISGLCYLTVGLIGLLYIVLNGKSASSSFFRFHFLQAILLGVLGCLLNWTAGAFISILGGMLGMFGDAASGPSYWIMTSISFLIHNISLAGILLLGYGAVLAFLGKSAEIPFVSNLVRQQIRY
jgi:uncharacterized membrane protein